MPVTIPTIEQKSREIRDLYRATVPGIPTGEESVTYRDSIVLASAISGLAQDLEAVSRDSVPVTAEGKGLEAFGETVTLPRKGATTATGALALRLTGAPSTIVPAGLTVIDRATGIALLTTTGVTLSASGGIGDVSVDTVAVGDIGTGDAANLPAGSEMDLSSPPANVNQACSLIADLTGGEDEELDGRYRPRVVSRFSQPPQGGNANDYEQTALLVPGVDSAYAMPVRAGFGSVDIAALRDGQGSDRLLSGSQKAEVEALILAFQPLPSSSRVIDPVPALVDTDVTLVALAGSASDWDDSTPPVVDSYDVGTRTVTTVDDLPDDLGVGDRLVFADDGRTFFVTALVASDQLRFSADDSSALSYTPSASVIIYSGGPIVEPVRDAILNGYTTAGDEFVPGINQLGPANEEGRYGAWIDTVEEARLAAAAISVPGVYRATVVSLAVDGTPTAPIARPPDPATPGALPAETLTIGLLVPGVVVVRYA